MIGVATIFPEAFIGRTCYLLDHTGQPSHGLLDKNIARATHQACGTGPRHHLHRQNAVAAEFEERVVDSDALQPEYLGGGFRRRSSTA